MEQPDTPVNIPAVDLSQLGKAKGFVPGVLIIESVLAPLEPTQLGHPYAPPIIPFDPTTEGMVKARYVSRFGPQHVELLTVRYENPAEQVRRLAWEAEAMAASCKHCGVNHPDEARALEDMGPAHDWEPEIVQEDGDDSEA